LSRCLSLGHCLVARHRCRGHALEVQIDLLAHVNADAKDRAAGKRSGTLVFLAYPVRAVVADAQPVAAEREMARLGPHRTLGNNLVIDIELRFAERLTVLARLFSNESHAKRVLTRSELFGNKLLLRLDSEEIIDVVQLLIFDKQRVAAETRAMREDHA